VKHGKYCPVKLANFEYFSITRGIAQISITCVSGILDSPYYVFVTLCIVVIVVSLMSKMPYFLSWPVQDLLKKSQVLDSQQQNIRENIQYFHSRPPSLSVIPQKPQCKTLRIRNKGNGELPKWWTNHFLSKEERSDN
jgi:sensor histidine kinase YesM